MKTLIRVLTLTLFTIINFQLFGQTDNIAVVSADKMNVLYIGIDNPVSIAVPGVTSDKLKVTINNGTITGSNGKYIVKVEKVIETSIEVTAEIKPGEIKKCGTCVFRIKRIPDPTPCLGNFCNTTLYISKDELLKDPSINISMNLPFDLKFEVVSFTATFKVKEDLVSKSVIGNTFNQGLIDLVKQTEELHKMYIEDIKVKGPDGSIRNLRSMIINIIEKDNTEKQ